MPLVERTENPVKTRPDDFICCAINEALPTAMPNMVCPAPMPISGGIPVYAGGVFHSTVLKFVIGNVAGTRIPSGVCDAFAIVMSST